MRATSRVSVSPGSVPRNCGKLNFGSPTAVGARAILWRLVAMIGPAKKRRFRLRRVPRQAPAFACPPHLTSLPRRVSHESHACEVPLLEARASLLGVTTPNSADRGPCHVSPRTATVRLAPSSDLITAQQTAMPKPVEPEVESTGPNQWDVAAHATPDEQDWCVKGPFTFPRQCLSTCAAHHVATCPSSCDMSLCVCAGRTTRARVRTTARETLWPTSWSISPCALTCLCVPASARRRPSCGCVDEQGARAVKA